MFFSLGFRIGAGVSVGFLALLSLSIYCLIVAAIGKFWSVLKKQDWYYVILCLAFGDIGTLVLYFIVLLPCTFTGSQVYGEIGTRVISSLEILFWSWAFYSTAVMALSRFTFFVTPKLHRSVFKGRNCIFATAGLIGFILFLHVLENVDGCAYNFRPEALQVIPYCPEGASFGAIALKIEYMIILLLPPFYFSLYVVIFVKISRDRGSSLLSPDQQHSRRLQRRMLAQAALIAGMSLVMVGIFVASSYVQLPLSGPICVLFNSAVNPVLYLIFNKDLRQKVGVVLGRKNNVDGCI